MASTAVETVYHPEIDLTDHDDFVSAVLAASWFLVGTATRTLEEVDDRVTIAQFRTLAVLGDRGQTNLLRLAEALGINPSAAMRLVDRLIALGLVSRQKNPVIRREVVLDLTPSGRKLVADVVAKRRAQIASLVESIPSAERQGMIAALRVFADCAEAAGLTPAAHTALGW
jgi:DNA-binding MarR family transcriptional regulator